MLSISLSLPFIPSFQRGGCEAGLALPKGLGAPPSPIDASARSRLLLSLFSPVCLQPLEGSCDESSLDTFQQQLKCSPGWGWEWEGSGAGQHQNAKWCSGARGPIGTQRRMGGMDVMPQTSGFCGSAAWGLNGAEDMG